jgi:hypothetical protein
MYLKDETLFVSFIDEKEGDPVACFGFIKEVIALSRFYNFELAQKRRVGKKFDLTRSIRSGIMELVNRTNTDPAEIDRVICQIRKGKLLKIKTLFQEKEYKINYQTDVDRLVTGILLDKNRVA